MPKKYPLVQKEAVRLELSRAVEEYNAELKKKTGKVSSRLTLPESFSKIR
jgi:hypothetical protein